MRTRASSREATRARRRLGSLRSPPLTAPHEGEEGTGLGMVLRGCADRVPRTPRDICPSRPCECPQRARVDEIADAGIELPLSVIMPSYYYLVMAYTDNESECSGGSSGHLRHRSQRGRQSSNGALRRFIGRHHLVSYGYGRGNSSSRHLTHTSGSECESYDV